MQQYSFPTAHDFYLDTYTICYFFISCNLLSTVCVDKVDYTVTICIFIQLSISRYISWLPYLGTLIRLAQGWDSLVQNQISLASNFRLPINFKDYDTWCIFAPLVKTLLMLKPGNSRITRSISRLLMPGIPCFPTPTDHGDDYARETCPCHPRGRISIAFTISVWYDKKCEYNFSFPKIQLDKSQTDVWV